MTNNSSYSHNSNNNCLHHKNKIIKFLCVPCGAPLCSDCIVYFKQHLNHSVNNIEYISIINVTPIIEELKQYSYPALISYRNSNKIVEFTSMIIKDSLQIDTEKKKIQLQFSNIHNKLNVLKESIINDIKSNGVNNNYNFKIQINNDITKISSVLSEFVKIESKALPTSSIVNNQLYFNNELIYYSNGEPVKSNITKLMLSKNVDIKKYVVPDSIKELHLYKNQPIFNNENNNIKSLYLHNMKFSNGIYINNIEECYRCFLDNNKRIHIVKQYQHQGYGWAYSINNAVLDNVNLDKISPSIHHQSSSYTFIDLRFDTDSNKVSSFFENLNRINHLYSFYFINQFNSNISTIIKKFNINDLYLDSIENEIESLPENLIGLALNGKFKFSIKSGIIHSNIRYLHLNSNTQISFDKSSTHADLKIYYNGPFNSNNVKGIVPDEIILGQVDHPLTQNHITPGTKILSLQNSFNQKLIKSLLPSSLQLLKYQGKVDIGLIKDVINRKSIKYISGLDYYEVTF